MSYTDNYNPRYSLHSLLAGFSWEDGFDLTSSSSSSSAVVLTADSMVFQMIVIPAKPTSKRTMSGNIPVVALTSHVVVESGK